MDVNFLNPFLEAAVEVITAEIQSDVQRGELRIEKSALTSEEVTVLISLVGEVQGVALYGMSIDTGIAIVEKIMGQEFEDFDDLAQSGVAELGNVITGRTTVKLSEAGYQTDISPPTMIIGENVSISTLDFVRVVVPLRFEAGTITAHLALQENQNGSSTPNQVPVTVN